MTSPKVLCFVRIHIEEQLVRFSSLTFSFNKDDQARRSMREKQAQGRETVDHFREI